MAKGAYQIGALRALQEFIPTSEIKYISCASVGLLNGYAYAINILDKAENMWHSICEDNSRLLISCLIKSNILQQNIKELHTEEVLVTNLNKVTQKFAKKKIIF